MSNVDCFFENQKKVILNELLNAKSEIIICMAWINDKDYFDALINAKTKGIRVELITSSRNHFNQFIRNNEAFFDYVGIVCLPGYGVMHKKYCVIDEKIILTGSYNWTLNAEYNNFENLIKLTDSNVALSFKYDFFETKVFSYNLFSTPERCQCGGKIFYILCIDNEDYNLQGECTIHSVCSKCGEINFITNDYEFNILNTLSSDNLTYKDILQILNHNAENNFTKKIHAIAIAVINPTSLEKTYKVIYKNKYFKRFIDDYYDF